LAGLQSVQAIDKAAGVSSGEAESAISIDDSQVKGIDLSE